MMKGREFDIDTFLIEFKKRMSECGYTSYRRLAADMSVDTATVTAFATYHRQPSKATIKKLAQALKEPESKWLTLAGYREQPLVALRAEHNLPEEAMKQIQSIIDKYEKEESNME